MTTLPSENNSPAETGGVPDKMNRYWQAAHYPTVGQIYQCEKSMIEPQTTLDVALPPHAVDTLVFESYAEPANRAET